jgi:hypothetical protein
MEILSAAHRIDEVNQFATFPIEYKEDRCSYCGSLSPSALVEAIRQGITVSWADRKYGWPHKLYLSSEFKKSIKFYTVHLRDASEEEKEIIAKACGLHFQFDTESYGDISWHPYKQKEADEES